MHRLRRQQRSRLTARASAPCYNKGKVERGGEGKSLHIRQCPPTPPESYILTWTLTPIAKPIAEIST